MNHSRITTSLAAVAVAVASLALPLSSSPASAASTPAPIHVDYDVSLYAPVATGLIWVEPVGNVTVTFTYNVAGHLASGKLPLVHQVGTSNYDDNPLGDGWQVMANVSGLICAKTGTATAHAKQGQIRFTAKLHVGGVVVATQNSVLPAPTNGVRCADPSSGV